MRLKSRTVRIETEGGGIKGIILSPVNHAEKLPGILWIHGGGYMNDAG